MQQGVSLGCAWGAQTSSRGWLVVKRIRWITGMLPQGSKLPAREWQRRHKIIVLIAVACSIGAAGLSFVDHGPGWHGVLESLIPGVIAALAWRLRVSNRIRASLASMSLMVTAVLVVHFFGTIEAHFLFFILVPVVALYEDWAPFATAAVFVFVHHAYAAAVDPASIYNHGDAIESPFLWSLIHSGLFLAICITSVVHWNIHEKSRTAERGLVDRLEQLALHDPLTGLANRELLDRRLTQALAEAHPHDAPVGLLMLDIDGFKRINDVHGHAAGDMLLKDVAQRLLACIRPGDTVARLGGDEFAIVLPQTGMTAASRVAQRILAVMADPLTAAGRTTSVGASIGVAASFTGQQPGQLVGDADTALYAAKRSGRGRFTIFSEELAAAGHEVLTVCVSDAVSWARYTRHLRAEISAAKNAGKLPAQTRGPDSVHRTMEELLNSIEQLPHETGDAGLALPERTPLEEFVYHHDMVHAWADGLAAKGILTQQRPVAAERFWRMLQQAVTGVPPQQQPSRTKCPATE